MGLFMPDSPGEKARHHAMTELRHRHLLEHKAHILNGDTWWVALRRLRDFYFDEFLGLLPPEYWPSWTTTREVVGKMKCEVCGGVLLEHRIGQCRPEAYSWL
jgi:hypothetical protein